MSPTRRRLIALSAGVLVATVLHSPTPAAAADSDLAAGRPFTASSSTDVYSPANANDGNASTYWESANNAFPQWLQVDLGSPAVVNQLTVALPPATAWATRTQTIAVRGSVDGSAFTQVTAAADYTFDPATGNTATAALGGATARYLRLVFTANTGWPAGQAAEVRVLGSRTDDPEDPGDPGDPDPTGVGARMPYTKYEAEAGTLGGGAHLVGPNRTVGDLAGEASGRRAVTLTTTGASVRWTSLAATNTIVARFSIPDNTTSSINVYVNDTLVRTLPLTSRYAWLYGAETNPQNSGTGPRHIYDEANALLPASYPAGSVIELRKDAANTGDIAIDFVDLEQVAPIANPNPAAYVVPSGFDQQAVQNALDAARADTTKAGVYLPAGEYPTNTKFQVTGRAVTVTGAGPWYTRFSTPQTAAETDAGFRADPTAGGSTFQNFAFFGNYTIRQDGPGKVFDWQNVSGVTIDNVWAEHTVCLYWGTNTDRVTIKNSRIRNLFADGINFTNGSTDNLITNNDARATGDDSYALFSATDQNSGDQTGNVFSHLTSTLTWRAAGLAVYGGYGNTFQDIYIADTLVYAGVTISSLDFGYPMNGFGASPPTVFDGITLVRDGGHFWGAQTFPALWIFSASKVFQGIRIRDLTITDPTYSGIMFQTNYSGGAPQNPITDTVLDGVTISGARRSGDAYDAKSGFGIWVNPLPEPGQGPAVGSATITNLTLTGNWRDVENTTSTFALHLD